MERRKQDFFEPEVTGIIYKCIVIGMCICLPLGIGFGIIHNHIPLGILFGNITGVIIGIIIGKFNEYKDRKKE